MPKRLPVFGLIALAALVLFAGCDRNGGRPLAAEIDESDYRLGQRLEKQGRNQEALATYLRLIEKRGDAAPESHLEAGILYLQQIKDPIAAIYHFRKYLERQPNAPQAPQVRGLVESAKREFARTLPANPMESQSDRLNMIDQIDRLQRENDQLKAELALARGNTVPASVNRIRMPADQAVPPPPTNQVVTPDEPADRSPLTLAPLTDDSPPIQATVTPRQTAPANPATAPAGSTARRHTVAKGDTLFSLAQRYYSNRSKWRDIYDANRDQLPDQNSLRIGMVLKIP